MKEVDNQKIAAFASNGVYVYICENENKKIYLKVGKPEWALDIDVLRNPNYKGELKLNEK